MKNKEKMDTKKNYLRQIFGKEYEKWKNEDYTDDRRLYCNLYEILMESLEEMEKVKSNHIHVAFNRLFKEDCETLKRIQEIFNKKAK